jgi:hypothetical protein
VPDDDQFGWLGKPAEIRAPTTRLLRVLWRMQARRVVTAGLYSHSAGTELRVFFEPESADDLLHSQVERFDVTALEDKAAEMRLVLLERGWLELPEVSSEPH